MRKVMKEIRELEKELASAMDALPPRAQARVAVSVLTECKDRLGTISAIDAINELEIYITQKEQPSFVPVANGPDSIHLALPLEDATRGNYTRAVIHAAGALNSHDHREDVLFRRWAEELQEAIRIANAVAKHADQYR